MSPDVEDPAVLRALYLREVDARDAWSRTGSNQASSGHVELSDSDMYDMKKEKGEHEVDARGGLLWLRPNFGRALALSSIKFPTPRPVSRVSWQGHGFNLCSLSVKPLNNLIA